jgi:hypothetical protein
MLTHAVPFVEAHSVPSDDQTTIRFRSSTQAGPAEAKNAAFDKQTQFAPSVV